MDRRQRPKNIELLVLMGKRGWTGRMLAAAAGVADITVSRLLNQRATAKPETVAKLAQALGVSPESLHLVED